ncbi:cyclin-dependent kinase inhibitor 1Ca, partial [Hippocampus zosterae]|uniref:cyclin-dependent kinase inhibitor 1Ca n=1 Tax=Hippocampus zosterae TaxID=109293 RepID=UPI00223D6378
FVIFSVINYAKPAHWLFDLCSAANLQLSFPCKIGLFVQHPAVNYSSTQPPPVQSRNTWPKTKGRLLLNAGRAKLNNNIGNMNGNARRCLFGPVDHEQLHQEMKLKFLEIYQEDLRRWNFNFKTETPLPGRFEWEKSHADCTVALYHESPQQKYTSPVLAAEDEDRSDQENCPSFSNQCAAEATPVRRKRMPPKAKENAQITGFLVQRKRSTEGKRTKSFASYTEAAMFKAMR